MLGKFEMGNPVLLGNLLIVPLCGESTKLEILDLEYGISCGVTIEEKGTVETVIVNNPLENHIFIMDGEELIGAWQDRISRYSVIVDKGRKSEIEVLCIERGRWERESVKKVFKSGFTAYPRLRELVTFHENGKSPSLQEKVWASIDVKLKTLSVSSATSSLHHSFDSVKGYMDIYLSWEPEEDVVGVMAFSNRGLLCMDIFSDSGLFRRLSKKLVAGYALDAIEDRMRGKVFEFSNDKILNAFKSMNSLKYKSSKRINDKCEQVILEGKLKGKVLKYNGSFVHATLFPTRQCWI
ncbi:MAG: ARPP-1 family domain-containing protein [Thermosulfidibacteraceae bacterium]|jgi:hypothetical protein